LGVRFDPAIFGMTGLAYSDSLLHRAVLGGFLDFVWLEIYDYSTWAAFSKSSSFGWL
jgi:hypothetical protein